MKNLTFFLFVSIFLAACNLPSAALQMGSSNNNALLPLAVGRTWTYQVTGLGSFPTCTTGTHSQTVTGQKIMGKVQGLQMAWVCENTQPNLYNVNGDVVRTYAHGSVWLSVLDQPVNEGHTWTSGARNFVWHQAGSVSVPAGNFGDCWMRQNTVVNVSYATFCRGVGMVLTHQEDANGNGWDGQLISKSF